MPRTKKPKPASAPVRPNGPLGEVLALAETAAYLRLPEKVVVTATASLGLPGRLVGGEWRFLKTALQDWLATAERPSGKDALLLLAGKYRDDPDIEGIVEEAMRARGRPLLEDGTYAGRMKK